MSRISEAMAISWMRAARGTAAMWPEAERTSREMAWNEWPMMKGGFELLSAD